VTDTYTLTLNNIDSASTAELNQTSVTLASGQSQDVELYVTDDDTVGLYQVNVTSVSDNDASVSGEISITTTVFGTLSSYATQPSGSPPPIYYEGQMINQQGYVYDELSNPIEGAVTTLESIYSPYVYGCSNVTDISGGYYNCTLDSSGMQITHYYNIRVNASKQYYHDATFTNNSVFLLAENQRAELSITKLPSLHSINDTTVVYNITNTLTNSRGSSQNTTLTDSDANETWNIGNIGSETVARSYLLEFERNASDYLVALAEATAEGYDPIYEDNLSAESNAPVIIIPKASGVKQLTLIKNLVYQSQTSTNITYEIIIDVINTGGINLENIEINDTDIELNEYINLTTGQSWQTSADMIIQKNPQPYTKEFAITSATADGESYYSNQQSILIPGYGGPYDVIVLNLPGSVTSGRTITGTVQVINQNTDVEDDRTLTTWIEDGEGVITDIDVRTVFVEKNSSINVTVSLTAPDSEGIYYFISRLTWPTAEANATKSFSVKEEEQPAGGGGGGGGWFPRNETPANETPSTSICGDGFCNADEMYEGTKACISDCGYDCDGNNIGESWTRCASSIIPEDLKQDLISLKNKINELEKEIILLKENGASTGEAESILAELKKIVAEIENKIANAEYGYAKNLIQNANAESPELPKPAVESPSGAVVGYGTLLKSLPWKTIISFVLIVLVSSLLMGAYYLQNQGKAIALLRVRRVRLERINHIIDKKIDEYLKTRRL
jgi:hypothetical protein